MTDRKLLELAAKAIGEEIVEHHYSNGEFHGYWALHAMDYWNPRDDDGDNRRLHVACRINLLIYENSPPELGLPRACAVAVNPSGEWFAEAFRPDESAAARLAVLRAAAAIGKDMK